MTAAPLTITVRAVGVREGRWVARHAVFKDGRLLCESRTPFLSAARILQGEGVPADTPLLMKHEGSDVISLSSTVGEAAGLHVREDEKRGPKFVPYRPFGVECPVPCRRISLDGHDGGVGYHPTGEAA